MSPHYFKMLFGSILPAFALCACLASTPVYERPTSGPLSTLTLANASANQRMTLETFVDGRVCKGKRRVVFDDGSDVPAREARSVSVAADQMLTLFATLETLETDEYAVELGATSGAPSPVRSRSFAAIGCNARLSFEVAQNRRYQVEIAEPGASRACTIKVLEFGAADQGVPVEPIERSPVRPRDELGPFCEPLQQ